VKKDEGQDAGKAWASQAGTAKAVNAKEIAKS
jgi:hypothetical protein